jgi:hypothetical protein
MWSVDGPALVKMVFVAAAALAFALLLIPDTMGDLGEYCRWTRRLVADGLEAAYFPSPMAPASVDPTWPIDYPPVLPYLLWTIGHVANVVVHGAPGHERLLGLLIRVPFVLAHLALGALIYGYVSGAVGRRAALPATAAHLFNPAILFDTCYWGQADALLALVLVAAFLAATRGRLEWGCVLLVVAALLKPLAYPYFALLGVMALRQGGWRRVLRCVGAGGVATAIVLLPFALIGRSADILRSLLTQVDSMPFASANAHNLWWLVTGGLPWTNASEPFLVGLSYQQAGMLLFGFWLAITMIALWRSERTDALLLAAAGTALGFFVLNTNLHENHLFCFLPLLSLAVSRQRSLRWFYATATATLLLNMVAHDPCLRVVIGPQLPGPRLTLPETSVALDEGVQAYLVRHGYRHLIELEQGPTTLVRLALTLVGSEGNLLLLVAWGGCQMPRRRLRQPCGTSPARGWTTWLLVSTAVVGLTTAPFVGAVRTFAKRQYFLSHLSAVQSVTAAGPVRWGSATIGGRARWVILAPPPSTLRYGLELPPNGRLALGATLGAAERPDGGSPVRFEVDVVTAEGCDTVWVASLDPRRTREREAPWIEASLDVSRYGGRAVVLVFRTSADEALGAKLKGVGWLEPGLI